MKKDSLFALVAFALLTGVGGCVRDDGGVGDGGEEIRFGVGASRAAVDGTSFPDGSSFDVWGWRDDADGGLVSVFDGTPVTLNGGAWSYEGLKYWVPGRTYDFYAVYPAGVVTEDTKSKILVKENFEAKKIDADAVDLMTAAALGKNGSAPEVVALAFDHQLSKVTIAVQAQQGVSATITDVRLYGLSETGTFECGISDTGAGFQWEQQQMGEATTEDNTSYYGKNGTVAVSNGGREDLMTVLAIPQGIAEAKLLVTYQREGEREQTARLALNTNFTEWKAGQAYNYTLSIAVDAITFSGITADAWDIRSSGGDINIGESTSN